MLKAFVFLLIIAYRLYALLLQYYTITSVILLATLSLLNTCTYMHNIVPLRFPLRNDYLFHHLCILIECRHAYVDTLL